MNYMTTPFKVIKIMGMIGRRIYSTGPMKISPKRRAELMKLSEYLKARFP